MLVLSPLCFFLQEDEIQKAIFVGNYDAAVDTCLKVGRLADALLIANIGGADLFKKTMQRYMRRNPRPYMAVSTHTAAPIVCWHCSVIEVSSLWMSHEDYTAEGKVA